MTDWDEYREALGGIFLTVLLIAAIAFFGCLGFEAVIRDYQRGNLPPCAPVEPPR